MQLTYSLTDSDMLERERIGRRSVALASLLVAATVAVLFWRRPDQFFAPMIWAEDSTILGDYAAHGWASIVVPIQGYHILSTKLITMSSYQLSFALAPYFALWITVAFTCLVVLAVAFSPTHLRWRPLCALAVLLVPTDGEVFAVSEYSFWWAGILLLLALLWDSGLPWLRVGYVVLGGLSSPLIGPVAVLLAGRAALERTRASTGIAALAIALAVVQGVTVYFFNTVNAGDMALELHTLKVASQRLVGFFYVGSGLLPEYRYSRVGYIMLAMLGTMVWLRRDRLDRHFALLVLIWAAICTLTIVRAPLGKIHPMLSGPRYFFYPFLLMTWAGLWIAAVSGPIVRSILAITYLAALWFAVTYEYLPGYKYAGFQRRHDPVDWGEHVARCAARGDTEKYVMPIHHNGDAKALWPRDLSGAQCRVLVADSIFR